VLNVYGTWRSEPVSKNKLSARCPRSDVVDRICKDKQNED
jgi:hypothetical protein